jgi:hypothetical protein
MAQSKPIDDSFLDETPDDSFLDEAPADASMDQGPPISAREIQDVRLPLGQRVKYALAKRKAGEKLEPVEVDAIKQYLNNPNGPEINTLDAVNALGANSAFGEMGDEILGYARAAMEKMRGNPEGFSSLAEKEKFALRNYLKRAQAQNPGWGVASQIAGAFGVGAMLPAGKIANAIQGAATGYGQSESKDLSDQAIDALGGAAAAHYGGEALKAAGVVGKGMARAGTSLAGKVLQLPGKGRAALEEWLGGLPMAKKGGDAPVRMSEEFGDTSGQAELRRLASEADHGQTAPRPDPRLDEMSTSDAMAELDKRDPRRDVGYGPNQDIPQDVITRDLAGKVLGFHEQALPTLNRMAREASPEAAAVQAGRAPTDEEAAQVMAALERLAKRSERPDLQSRWARGLPSDLNAPDRPSGYDARWKPSMSQDVAAGHAADYRREFPNASDESVNRYIAEAADYDNTDARFMDRKRGGVDEPSKISPVVDPNATVNRRTGKPLPMARNPQAEPGPNDLQIHGQVVPNARDPRTPLPPELAQPKTGTEPIRATAPDAQKIAPWDASASQNARERLQKQANGARLLGRAGKASPLVGAAIGGAAGGVPGAMLGAMTGKSAVGAGIDFATEIGKHLQAVSSGAMRPESFAQKMASDPRLATQMASMPGKMGYAGREIARALKEGGTSAAKARAWTIANQAWFREQLQQDTDGQAAPSSTASAP